MPAMLDTLVVAARERARLTEVAAILGKAGLGDILSRLGLGRWLGALGLDPPAPGKESGRPARFRRALESLGPVYIKLGQILSTRGDLLPPPWVEELSKLQTGAPRLPWPEIRALVEAELGAPIADRFQRFDEDALAAASIAQVHRAWLPDGTAVVVKIRRPGLREVVNADMRLLAHLAALAERHSAEIARYRPREIARHLAASIQLELDLSNEARNAAEVAANLEANSAIVVPRIHAEFTTDTLLVQDYLDGIEPADDGRIEAAGLDGPLMARRGAEAFLSMVVVDGVFHADPHPGNLLALPENKVGFIDFGAVGRIGEKRRKQLLAFIGAIVRGRSEDIAVILLDWSAASDPDLGRLEAAADAFVARHGRGTLDLGAAITDMLALARDNRLTFPSDLAILFKALATADGVMKRLDPDFDAIEAARPIVRRAALGRLGPGALKQRGEEIGLDLLSLAEGVPALVKLVTHRLRQGGLKAEISVAEVDRFGLHLNRAATKIAIALVVGAFAIGLAPELARAGPAIQGAPLFVVLGVTVVAAGLATLALLGRRREGQS